MAQQEVLADHKVTNKTNKLPSFIDGCFSSIPISLSLSLSLLWNYLLFFSHSFGRLVKQIICYLLLDPSTLLPFSPSPLSFSIYPTWFPDVSYWLQLHGGINDITCSVSTFNMSNMTRDTHTQSCIPIQKCEIVWVNQQAHFFFFFHEQLWNMEWFLISGNLKPLDTLLLHVVIVAIITLDITLLLTNVELLFGFFH